MKVLLQRVGRAEVRVASRVVGKIGAGLLALVGVEHGDDGALADWYADKTAELRIFPDDGGRMNRSVEEAGGGVLVVSQFTLAGRTRKGRRPSWTDAADPALAEPLVRRYAARLAERGLAVEQGEFGAMMEVELVNDGPVTLMLEGPR